MSNYTESTAFLQQLASQAELETRNTRSMIWNLTEPNSDEADLRDPDFDHTVSPLSLEPPPRLSDFLDKTTDTTDATLAKLDADADAWLAKYFPSVGDCLRTLPDEFLCQVISGVKPFGLDATVFELVWHRARDKAYSTMATEQRALEAAYTSRGFTLPPGALAVQMAAAADKAADAIAEVNREQAIKDAEIRLELLKFAEEQALNYKRGILQSLADFYRLWISLPDKDIERARLQASATASLYSALSSYYNVELGFEDLKLKTRQVDVDTDLAVDRNRIANRQANDAGGKAAALAQAARAFGDVAAQAAASAGSLVAEIENI